MGEKYIKKENGKEVVYEKGIFVDSKVGELKESKSIWDDSGTKVVEDFWGNEQVRIEPPSFFSCGERKATVDGEEGVFSSGKGLFESHPTFKPEEKEDSESSLYSSGYSSSSEGSSYSGGGGSSASGSGVLGALFLLGLGVIGVGTCINEANKRNSLPETQNSVEIPRHYTETARPSDVIQHPARDQGQKSLELYTPAISEALKTLEGMRPSARDAYKEMDKAFYGGLRKSMGGAQGIGAEGLKKSFEEAYEKRTGERYPEENKENKGLEKKDSASIRPNIVKIIDDVWMGVRYPAKEDEDYGMKLDYDLKKYGNSVLTTNYYRLSTNKGKIDIGVLFFSERIANRGINPYADPRKNSFYNKIGGILEDYLRDIGSVQKTERNSSHQDNDLSYLVIKEGFAEKLRTDPYKMGEYLMLKLAK
ncbi:MAG: hypothetical protein Q7S74_01220 [Nanoarchaeota archaeon]|nr:hypothetical protein [Nanoarchaeota archaeon]